MKACPFFKLNLLVINKDLKVGLFLTLESIVELTSVSTAADELDPSFL
jgi:hypothetical protein